MYTISFPCALYFGKSVNLYDQSSFVFVFPVTTCSFVKPLPVNTYLIDVGLLPFAFELSSQTLFTCTSILSAGTVNVFVSIYSFSVGFVIAL